MSSELWERLAALNKRVLLFNRCIRGRGEGTEPTTEHSKGTNGFRYSWSQILPVLRLFKMPTSLLCRGSDVRQVLRPWAVLRDGERPVKGHRVLRSDCCASFFFTSYGPWNKLVDVEM